VTDPEPGVADASRRTWLALERTWLAWWRTGIAAGAVALGVGRFLPSITHGAQWPYRVLGIGYGLLSVAILLVGAARQRSAAEALRRGEWEQVSSVLVTRLTACAIALSIAAVAVVAAGF
jgi:uncharacterized membrane protein YidH (DUF202 family)